MNSIKKEFILIVLLFVSLFLYNIPAIDINFSSDEYTEKEYKILIKTKAIYNIENANYFFNIIRVKYPKLIQLIEFDDLLHYDIKYNIDKDTLTIIFDHLIQYKKRDLTHHKLLISLIHYNNIYLLKQILEVDAPYQIMFNPSAYNNYALNYTVYNNQIEIVSLLLHDKRADPRNCPNLLTIAVEKGYKEIVQLLLFDKRIHPSIDNNTAIYTASRFNQTTIVPLLLKDPRLTYNEKFDSFYNFGLNEAVRNNYTIIVNLLLKDRRADPSLFDNLAIMEAAENNYYEIFKLLLADDRVDSIGDDNLPLRKAAKNGYLEIVQLLLKNKFISKNNGYKEAMKEARNNGHIKIYLLLLLHNASNCF